MTTTDFARDRQRTVVITWTFVVLVAGGLAWTFGFDSNWWQRAALVLPAAALGAADFRDFSPVVEARLAATRVMSELGWMQTPLAVAGGAWLAGLTPDTATRLTLIAVIVLVAALFRYAPTVPAPAGGPR